MGLGDTSAQGGLRRKREPKRGGADLSGGHLERAGAGGQVLGDGEQVWARQFGPWKMCAARAPSWPVLEVATFCLRSCSSDSLGYTRGSL